MGPFFFRASGGFLPPNKNNKEHNHWDRTLFCLLFAQRENLSEQDADALAMAACFYDSRRINDGLDIGHGHRLPNIIAPGALSMNMYWMPALFLSWHTMNKTTNLARPLCSGSFQMTLHPFLVDVVMTQQILRQGDRLLN